MAHDIQLSALEARIIGCLIEKEITTPDQYPLSLNALVNACNQKSNREPVIAATEAQVQAVLDALANRRLVTSQSGYGSRVPKYQHRFCNSDFGRLKFSAQELALVCELLLRGAQMPGELRSRAERMAAFKDSGEVEQLLDQLAARADGPFVVKLAREPGRRESRYMHLFGDAALPAAAAEAPIAHAPIAEASAAEPARPGLAAEVAELRAEVAQLRAELAEVKAALNRA